MSTVSQFDDRTFRFALAQVAKSVELMYRTPDRLCCTDARVADHVRALADRVATEVLDTFKHWPPVDE